MREYIGEYDRAIKGDTGSLDYGSCKPTVDFPDRTLHNPRLSLYDPYIIQITLDYPCTTLDNPWTIRTTPYIIPG